MKTRIVLVAAVTVLAATTAGSCGDAPADKFTRDCVAKGGHVSTTHRGGSTTKICLPPPGGW